LRYCSSNAICSHGNKLFEEAITQGEEVGKLSPARAEIMRGILTQTRRELLETIDQIAVLKRILQENPTDHETRQKIERVLGTQESEWNAVHAKLQVLLAEPILEITRVLAGLGLLELKENLIHVDTAKLAKARSPV
jgi:hypothetical protein